MAKTIHAILDSKVHRALLEEAERRGISISKAVQRAIVIAFGVDGVPVFTYGELGKLGRQEETSIPGPDALPGESMVVSRQDIENEMKLAPSCRSYASADELLQDLRHGNTPAA
jgi:hypothetical protein